MKCSSPARSRQYAWLSLLAAPAILAIASSAFGKKESSAPDPKAFETGVQPLLKQYCIGCHSKAGDAGGLNLEKFTSVADLQKDPTTWRKVLGRVREKTMPPQSAPQPSQEQRDQIVHGVDSLLAATPESLIPKNPGKVIAHRLSRTEYNNTVRDLFGITSKPANRFPPDSGGGGGFDNNADTLYVPPILMEQYLEAAGTILNEAAPARIFIVRPSAALPKREAARKILAFHATRAYRRPATPADTDRLLRLYDGATKRGARFDDAVKLGLKAALVSPAFLFRIESDGSKPGTYPIDDYALVCRLSYFLWSSMPDDELFRLAAQKRLRQPGMLEAQARRMLKDPKADAFADGFAGQWLRVRELYSTAHPDPGKFPEYTPAVRDAMYQETVTFFRSVVNEDRNLLRLLDSDYTYVNEDLAKLYGIPGITGPQMRRVYLPDGKRGGVLTMGAVLTLSSYPQRTSPVLRGKWILADLLGTPPPPPPPVVATLSTNDAPENGLTFRQRLEKHREKPECAGCHSRMDPLGFGLENYDAIGRWRTMIGNLAVDAAGSMPDGSKFTGPTELKKYMLTHKKDAFVQHLTEKMLAYALGRGLEPYDQPTVRRITTALSRDNYRASCLITEIVKSYPFQYRQDVPTAVKTAHR